MDIRKVTLVGVNETEAEERTTLGIRGGVDARLGEVRVEDVHRLREVVFVNDAEGGRGEELGPVGRTRKPLEVLAEEGVARGSRVHDGVGDHEGLVEDRVAGLRIISKGTRERETVFKGESTSNMSLIFFKRDRSVLFLE
jgi:hypothetical protein